MAIGVSYTGFDGATRNFHAESAKDLAKMMPSIGTKIPSRTHDRTASSRTTPQTVQTPTHDAVDGPLVGIEGNDALYPDGQMRMVGARGGWRIPITRTEMEVKPSVEMKCNEVTLVKLEYDLIISEAGFVKGRTEERIVWRKSFFVVSEGSESEGGAKANYCVRPVFRNGALSALFFGSDEDLSSDDYQTLTSVSKVETTTCPNGQ